MKNFVAFDLETTGFDPRRASIIEIGAIRFDRFGHELGRLSLLIDPGGPIPDVVSKLTHIRDEDVRGGFTQEEAVRILLDFCKNDYIVGHGVSFDVGFCQAIVKGAFENSLVFDTQKIAQKLYTPVETIPNIETLTELLVNKKRIQEGTYTLPSLTKQLIDNNLIPPGQYTFEELAQTCIDKKLVQRGRYTLENLARLVGARHSNPHRAWSDAQATASLFRKLLKRAHELPNAEISALRTDTDVQQNPSLHEFFSNLVSLKRPAPGMNREDSPAPSETPRTGKRPKRTVYRRCPPALMHHVIAKRRIVQPPKRISLRSTPNGAGRSL
ncbi:MAG: 3'-5' exonuclease [Candidatus Dormibacteria bacterium]